MDIPTITIAGREWKGIGRNATLEHDVYTTRAIADCGLDAVDVRSGESADQLVRRIFLLAAGSPRFYDVMGCVLIPAEAQATDWTPVLAHANGRIFANVTTPGDKAAIKQYVVEMLTGFLGAGITLLRSSPNSSPVNAVRPRRSRRAAR